ncbi:MAG: hypothetical protein JJE15_07935 [Desulfobacteraceae bacterium]|nr:hypothetical protein [Desulfobacteraceae bacterium]
MNGVGTPKLWVTPMKKPFQKEFKNENGDDQEIQAVKPYNRFRRNIKPIFSNKGKNRQEGHQANEDSKSMAKFFHLSGEQHSRHEKMQR